MVKYTTRNPKIKILSESDISFLNGLLDDLDELPDGAWQAMCEDLIEGCDEFKGLDPNEVWLQWVKQTSPQIHNHKT